MTISSLDPTPFRQYFEARVPSFGNTPLPIDTAAYLHQLQHDFTEPDMLRGYAKACPVPGTEPDDYAPALLTFDNGSSVIAHIHFHGWDGFQFVDISAQTGPLPEPLPREIVAAPFRRFHPRTVRIWQMEGEVPPAGGTADKQVVAAPARILYGRDTLPGADRIKLERCLSLDFQEHYRQIYDAVHSTFPGTASVSSPEDKSDLKLCLDTGAFFRVLIDGLPAGYIGARPDSFRCWKGWHIVEEVLHPDFMGQRLAPPMQQAFLRALELPPETCIFGTINARNARSLKTALRVGRRIVESGVLLHLNPEIQDGIADEEG